jgi:hypothetical protein
VSKRAGKIFLGEIACIALGVAALGLLQQSRSPGGIDDAQIKYQVGAALTVEGGAESQHDFTAELEKSNGVWLVSLVRLTNVG